MTAPDLTRGKAHVEVDLLLGAKAIATFLGMQPYQVGYLARNGGLPHFRVGNRLSATRTGLTAWLSEQQAQALAEHKARTAA